MTYIFENITGSSLKDKLLLGKHKAIKLFILHVNLFFSPIYIFCTDVYCSYPYYILFDYDQAKKILLFLDIQVMRKIFTQAAANLFFLISLIEFFK